MELPIDDNSQNANELCSKYIERTQSLVDDFFSKLEVTETPGESEATETEPKQLLRSKNLHSKKLLRSFIENLDPENVDMPVQNKNKNTERMIRDLWENLKTQMLSEEEETDPKKLGTSTKRYVKDFIDELKDQAVKSPQPQPEPAKEQSKITLSDEEKDKLKLFRQL